MSGKEFYLRREATLRLSLAFLSFLLIASIAALSQSSTQSSGERSISPATANTPANSGPLQEFPVTMRQNVAAGKTPVGTKVEARLTIATLVKGAVIPEGAIFRGEVIESVAKSKAEPSRLAIRVDSVQWKKESRPMKLFLTVWYYPILMGEDAQTREGDNSPPIMQNPNAQGFPNPRTPPDLFPQTSRLSETRITMKDVESSRAVDGTITLTSSKSNLKLDKSTTYVLANGDLGAPVKLPEASDHTKK